MSCRSELERILQALPYAMEYHILYDIGSHTYVWNIVPAFQVAPGSGGVENLIPIKKKN